MSDRGLAQFSGSWDTIVINTPVLSSLNRSKVTLLGDMPVKFIGNYFVTFVYRYQVLGFIGNYAVCELPIKSIGKCFITAI